MHRRGGRWSGCPALCGPVRTCTPMPFSELADHPEHVGQFSVSHVHSSGKSIFRSAGVLLPLSPSARTIFPISPPHALSRGMLPFVQPNRCRSRRPTWHSGRKAPCVRPGRSANGGRRLLRRERTGNPAASAPPPRPRRHPRQPETATSAIPSTSTITGAMRHTTAQCRPCKMHRVLLMAPWVVAARATRTAHRWQQTNGSRRPRPARLQRRMADPKPQPQVGALASPFSFYVLRFDLRHKCGSHVERKGKRERERGG